MKYLLALLMLFSSAAYADFDSWSTTDKSLFAAHTALLVADWGQTRYISQHPDQYHETSYFLGQHPSQRNVDLFFVAQLVGSYYLLDYAKKERTTILLGLTIARASTVHHNANIGVKIGF
jgi:hypothetical protein